MNLPPLQVAQTRAGRLGYIVSGSGKPHIVLVNGAGMSLEGWEALYPDIEQLGTVFAYNRLGIKGSDAAGQPQSGAVIVATLRELLAYAGLEPPCVLVGHSLGCLYVDLFARLHPGETAAMLLVEPTLPDEPADLREREGEFAHGTSKALGLPQPMLEANLHLELASLEITLQQLRSAGPRPPVPCRVLHARGHFPQLSQPGVVLRELASIATAAAAG
ncbi:alpha/beta fold hydrolase [Ramlibacter albus]|uniref:Alpha/beta hydrolase n=1 Tax=Ramlibacter albus TaxID=2079448 RepID=A0A923S3L1_9BURK|nr:alpha/beta hydrolase [Ramlibacter albus]MBC5766536.1 alpha/beta hydrolase [Ramlibacter albus]